MMRLHCILIRRKPVLPFYGRELLASLSAMSKGWHFKVDLRMIFPTLYLAKMKIGWKLFDKFMRPLSELSPHKPHLTPAAIAKGFKSENIFLFFDKYESFLVKIQIAPHRHYNLDKAGLTVVQRILASTVICTN
jgi:hypothetical protein